MNFRRYEPNNEDAWLNFLTLVQTHSDAWEALYTQKPDFHTQCDYILAKGDQIIGVIAGHHIPTQEERQVFSIEILASHPMLQNKGIARTMIAELSRLLPKESILTFWTRSINAKSWYEYCGMTLIDEKFQFFTSSAHKTLKNLVRPTQEDEESNLWCYACTCPIS